MKKMYKAAAALSCLLLFGMGCALTEAHGHWSRGYRGYGDGYNCGPRGYYCEPQAYGCERGGYYCGTQAYGGRVDELEPNPEVMRAPAMQRLNGTISSIEGRRVEVKDADGRSVSALLNRDTYIVDGAKGNLRLPGALQVGQKVSLYHSSRMTRSLPPQALAYAIILGGQDAPLFFPVDQVQLAEDGQSVRVLNSNNDVIATIDGEACPDYEQILPGDILLVWSKMMTMSLPGQTNAEKAVILP